MTLSPVLILALSVGTVPKPESLFLASAHGLRYTAEYAGKAADAAKLAKVRRQVAADLKAGKFRAAAEKGPEPLAAAVLDAVRQGNNASGVDPERWKWWATLVDVRTGTFYALGRLDTVPAWIDGLEEIALGLET
jgi:hypothetical protein